MGARILCYHEVGPRQAAAFARQLDFLTARWGRIEPLSIQSLRSAHDAVVLSFDDGDATLAEVVQPLLDARGVRAILYVATGFVQCGRYDNGRELRRALSWEQLGRWVEAGHQLGSHTHTHANLLHCPHQQIVDELAAARELLRRHVGVDVQHFAYPWGQFDARVLAVVSACGGFGTAATIDRGSNAADTPLLALRRDLADPTMSLAGLRARLWFGRCKGLYRGVRAIRRRPVTLVPAGAGRPAASGVLAPPIGDYTVRQRSWSPLP